MAAAIANTDAVDYTRQAADAEAELALQAIQVFPDSIYKQTLVDFCTAAVQRDH